MTAFILILVTYTLLILWFRGALRPAEMLVILGLLIATDSYVTAAEWIAETDHLLYMNLICVPILFMLVTGIGTFLGTLVSRAVDGDEDE